MSEFDPVEYGVLTEKVDRLESDMRAVLEELKAIRQTLSETRGGVKTVIWIGGAGIALGGLLTTVWQAVWQYFTQPTIHP